MAMMGVIGFLLGIIIILFLICVISFFICNIGVVVEFAMGKKNGFFTKAKEAMKDL